MKPSFRITPRAYDDLRNIARYTRQQWGQEQRDRYMRALDERFQWLAEQPQAGKHRPDVCEGYYCFPQGSHLVFYLIGPAAIDIIGCLTSAWTCDRDCRSVEGRAEVSKARGRIPPKKV